MMIFLRVVQIKMAIATLASAPIPRDVLRKLGFLEPAPKGPRAA
jgi:hypothetical protein